MSTAARPAGGPHSPGVLTPDGKQESPFRRKPVAQVLREGNLDEHGNEHADTGHGLARSISTFSLMMIGVGATIGTGIFFVLSEAVPEAGPATVLSFILAAVVAGLTALCYSELASMIPVAGSTYSYTYSTLGEIVAFAVSACLLLEYGVSAAAVAVGWSEYVNKFLSNVTGYFMGAENAWQIPHDLSVSFMADKDPGIINLPALVLVLLCTLLLIRGAKESALTNAIMVIIKIGVLLMFVVIALFGFKTSNFTPFFSPEFGNGWVPQAKAIAAAAGLIFFSYVGLDAISTAGEEVKNPKKALPTALIGALLIVTSVYVLVAVAGIGAQDWHKFKGQEAGLAEILDNVTGNLGASTVLSAGAIISIFSVTLVTLYGQTRILFSIARDGLLPPAFERISDKTRTPVFNTVLVGLVIGLMAAVIPLSSLWNLVSLGTLIAFSVVSVGVIILRFTNPHAERGFRVPGYPVTPILTIAACIWLISSLGHETWLAGLVMLAGGMMFYGVYGYAHSHYNPHRGEHDHYPGLLKWGALGSGILSLLMGIGFWALDGTHARMELLKDADSTETQVTDVTLWEKAFEMDKPENAQWVYVALIAAGVVFLVAAAIAFMAKTDSTGRSEQSIRPAYLLAYTAVLVALVVLGYFIIFDITVGLSLKP